MCLFFYFGLLFSLNVRVSLTESTTPMDFESRYITRPSIGKEFPYAVYIEMSRASDGTCSGSLLTLEWVLTAGRCMCDSNGRLVETNKSLIIYAGVVKSLSEGQVRKSITLFIHNVNNYDDYYTIALAQVNESFKPSLPEWGLKTLQPLKLEMLKGFGSQTEEQMCSSGSYGRIQWNVERPPVLKKTINVIQQCNCSETLKEAFPYASTDHWMCGEYVYNLGLCKGDFGATLKCGGDSVAVAFDIVTFRDSRTCDIKYKVSQECSKTLSISVYMDVCPHLEWIHSHIPTIPPNTTACGVTDAAVSLHTNSYWRSIVYFTVVYFTVGSQCTLN